MLDHGWNYSCEEFTTQLQAWIGIDLDEPNIVACVNHEIQAEYLEVMLGIIGVQLQISGFNSIESDSFHFGINHLRKIELPLTICRIHIPLELIVGYFVSFFVFAIAITIFLNGVISKMDYRLADVLDVELIWWGADVALAEPISPHCPVEAWDKHIVSNIKFPILIE